MASRLWLLLALTLSLTACSSSRATARAPTHREREAIVNALPAFLREIPVGCLELHIRVSTSSRYAFAGPEFFNAIKPPAPCLRYASNGYFILHKAPRWKIVFNGSDLPPCSLNVPRELARC